MVSLSLLGKFTVRTFDEAALTQAAQELAAMAHGFAPTLVIGIRSGGFVVAERVIKFLPQASLLAATCRRPSTEQKQSMPLAKKVLRVLPHAVNDRLRILEHIALTEIKRPRSDAPPPLQSELDEISRALRAQGDKARILIVDDSVDSGATLQSVNAAVKSIAGGVAVKTAAITVTTDAPLLTPDFFLYRHVLCRFPWSLDAKA